MTKFQKNCVTIQCHKKQNKQQQQQTKSFVQTILRLLYLQLLNAKDETTFYNPVSWGGRIHREQIFVACHTKRASIAQSRDLGGSRRRAKRRLSSTKMPRAPSATGDKPGPSKEGSSLGDGPRRLEQIGQSRPRDATAGLIRLFRPAVSTEQDPQPQQPTTSLQRSKTP